MNPLENLLSRLENVKPSGKGHTACCPAHDSKSRSSLHIAVGDNNCVIMKCHGGCLTLDVLHAVGLEMGDLFERPTETVKTPRPSWQQREMMKMRQWKACRADFIAEINVCLSALWQAYHDYPISDDDKVRMERAERIIRGTLEHL